MIIAKAKKGYTLVEVIVVAVIVAILAAVAIPLYVNYLSTSKQDAVDQLAQTAAAAADGYYRKTGSDPIVSNLNLFYDATKYTISISSPNVTVTLTSTSFTKSVAYK